MVIFNIWYNCTVLCGKYLYVIVLLLQTRHEDPEIDKASFLKGFGPMMCKCQVVLDIDLPSELPRFLWDAAAEQGHFFRGQLKPVAATNELLMDRIGRIYCF